MNVMQSPLFLALGVIIYFSLKNEPSNAYFVLIAALSIAQGLILFWLNTRNDSNRTIGQPLVVSWSCYAVKFILCASLLIFLGFLAMKFRTEIISTEFIKKEKCFKNITGTIREISIYDKYTRLLIEYESKSKVRIISRIKNNEVLEVGSKVLFSACLKPPANKVTPFGYDEAMFFYFDRIIAKGFVTSQIKVIEKNDTFFSRIREKLYKNFKENIQHPYSEIASALVVGKKDGIPNEIKQDFRDSGTSHLLAISGLHLSLVGFIIFNSIRFLLALCGVIAFDTKKIASVFAIVFSYFYLQIAGAPVSAERAFIMISLFFLSVLLDRRSNIMRSISFAAIVIIIFSPENVLKPGFQMSFFAVLGICSGLINTPFYAGENLIKKFFIFFLGIIISSSLAIFATFPFTIYHFNNFSVNGIFANLIAIPIVTFVTMPLIIISLILMPIINISLIYKLIALSLGFLVRFNHYISISCFEQLSIRSFSGTAVTILAFGMLALFLSRTRLRYIGFVLIVIGLINAHHYKPPDLFISRKNVMFKGVDDQYYLIGKKTSTVNRWLEHCNATTVKSWVNNNNSWAVKVEKVNDYMYIYEKHGKKIAFVYDKKMLDCSKYDLIFSSESKCKNASLFSDSVYFLWLDRNEFNASVKNRKWQPKVIAT